MDDGKVVVTGGDKGAVLADAKTGKQAWRCEGLTDPAGYSSLIIREIGDIKQYIQLPAKAWRALMPATANCSGALIAPATAVISTPIYDKGTLFDTSAYGVGCNGFKVEYKNNQFVANEIYKHVRRWHGEPPRRCHRVGDYVYGSNSGQLSCLRLSDGEVMWNERSAGKGAIIVADNKIILRTERAGFPSN